MPDPISWALAWPYLLAAFAGGYFAGSVPFGLVLTKLTGAGDLRSIGSGSIGATNVLRTGRKDLAAATLALDAAKGAIAVAVAGGWGIDMAIAAGFGAILGHMFPLWLKFNGGKGVATYVGILFGLYWPAGLFFLGVWIVVAVALRYSSLAALTATLATPGFMAFTGEFHLMETAIIIGVLIFTAHRANIKRLIRGVESRIGGS
ncbi:Acyl-phosphate:glycerol-3-phosphate O-acyltransferase PlsY (EC 2.3.1.n3) [hydrothermal vent metagenome]|uniref:Acyl-phosphate:glycerol-3-phosphate O-acyltransferase PlsY n=1 Tax=hydrothermal vent metagenome TaxID=652676 RepID=A0A3B0TF67_9ZZZZ